MWVVHLFFAPCRLEGRWQVLLVIVPVSFHRSCSKVASYPGHTSLKVLFFGRVWHGYEASSKSQCHGIHCILELMLS